MEKTEFLHGIDEIAKALDVGKTTARALVHRKDFPAVWIGPKKILVSKEALSDWLVAMSKKECKNDA